MGAGWLWAHRLMRPPSLALTPALSQREREQVGREQAALALTPALSQREKDGRREQGRMRISRKIRLKPLPSKR